MLTKLCFRYENGLIFPVKLNRMIKSYAVAIFMSLQFYSTQKYGCGGIRYSIIQLFLSEYNSVRLSDKCLINITFEK